MADSILHVQHHLVHTGKTGLWRHDLVQDAELEVADVGLAVYRVLAVLRRQLAALNQVGDYLAQVDVYALMILEAEVQPDAENVVRALGLDLVAHHARFVVHGRADEPVRRGALRVLVEDGI